MPTRDTEAFFKRQDLIKAKLKSRELTPEDIKTYNENDNPTNLCKFTKRPMQEYLDNKQSQRF